MLLLLQVCLLPATAYSLPSNILTDDDSEYVDIDEGALVKVEFSKTLRKEFCEKIQYLSK